MRRRSLQAALVAVGTAAALSAPVGSAGADHEVPPPPDPLEIDLPAGVACADFDLRLVAEGAPKHRVFRDEDGNVIKVLMTGPGYTITVTNLDTDESLNLPSRGASSTETLNPDGTWTVRTSGHSLLILFPTDVDADGTKGPSTRLIVGNLRYTRDDEFNFTVHSVNGKVTDICAALS